MADILSGLDVKAAAAALIGAAALIAVVGFTKWGRKKSLVSSVKLLERHFCVAPSPAGCMCFDNYFILLFFGCFMWMGCC